MSCPTPTGSGESVLTMPTSALVRATTRLVAVALLFPPMLSVEVVVMPALHVSGVPAPVAALTFIVIGRENDAPEANVVPVQVIVPVPPTAGVMHVQPAGGTPMAWKVSLAGTFMVNVGTLAVKLPRLETTFV